MTVPSNPSSTIAAWAASVAASENDRADCLGVGRNLAEAVIPFAPGPASEVAAGVGEDVECDVPEAETAPSRCR
jgi:hypothetical protein